METKQNKMILSNGGEALPFVVEASAYEGVRRIAAKVAKDVEKVGGIRPAIYEAADAEAVINPEDGTDLSGGFVLCATWGKSALLEELCRSGKLMMEEVAGKREVYGISLVEKPFPGIARILVICGSDKRGSIYGLFALSEYIGVSPLCYWGDVEPLKRAVIEIGSDIVQISREPSVKYRGFFINDEWPCFGNWTFSHFGGFTAEMYDHVFELLLRLKGNYLWPAMWTSSFPLDGPGLLNEELADIYGVVIGFSHHEPCLRASEEWDKVRGEDSPYGNEWNYYTNPKGLEKYWADGLKRSGIFEHIVTIGMRGERDSSMLGEQATLKENIDLLKSIIRKQRKLIGENINQDVDQVPQLLALYKEVEAYFYGDEHTEGLKEWKELDNVIFMLCEDNYGHMRTLPSPELRSHKGGFGMYYHFDYHGSPVSYEWMPSTPLSRVWEQMTMAYDYGIQDVWIVNVGDLKGNEVALSYFLALAYDYDTWGSSAPNSWQQYMLEWAACNYPGQESGKQEAIAAIYTDYVAINALRRPEALHPGIYHPCHYNETKKLLERARRLEERNESIYSELKEENVRDAYYSMVYYPAKTSMNLLKMHLYAGLNAHYASQGRKVANVYGEKLAECIVRDRELSAEFGSFRGGKWRGMELEEHIGFTKWNDDGWRYPVQMRVEPVTKPRMSVSRADDEMIAVKNYGTPTCIRVDDFLSPGIDRVSLEISNDGVGSLDYEITGEIPAWLQVSPMKGSVAELTVVDFICDSEHLPWEAQTAKLLISDGNTQVAVAVSGRKHSCLTDITEADNQGDRLPAGTFLPCRDMIVMEAHHYTEKKDTDKGSFTLLTEYGRSGYGMKVLPSTADFTETEDKPSLTYSFCIPEEGDYRVELWTEPTNSLQHRRPLRVMLKDAAGQPIVHELLSSAFRGGDPGDEAWCQGTLDQIRITGETMCFDKGLQTLTVEPLEAGVIIERILIYGVGKEPAQSYLGPEESYRLQV